MGQRYKVTKILKIDALTMEVTVAVRWFTEADMLIDTVELVRLVQTDIEEHWTSPGFMLTSAHLAVVARSLYRTFKRVLPRKVKLRKVRVWREEGLSAEYGD